MKARNLVLGLMLATNVLTAHSAMIVPAGATSAIVASNMAAMSAAMSAASTTVTSTVSSSMMNSNNSVVVECTLEKELVRKEGEWVGTPVASYKKTIEDSRCQWNKEAMEQLNNTHYKFGKVKGIFKVRSTNHVMIELVEVNE